MTGSFLLSISAFCFSFLHWYFCLVPCGRLSWLCQLFGARKYSASYRIVPYRNATRRDATQRTAFTVNIVSLYDVFDYRGAALRSSRTHWISRKSSHLMRCGALRCVALRHPVWTNLYLADLCVLGASDTGRPQLCGVMGAGVLLIPWTVLSAGQHVITVVSAGVKKWHPCSRAVEMGVQNDVRVHRPCPVDTSSVCRA